MSPLGSATTVRDNNIHTHNQNTTVTYENLFETGEENGRVGQLKKKKSEIRKSAKKRARKKK
jgi:hypothetical protein